LFVVSVTGSRIFAGCQLLSRRRVDDWVSTYHSWEQPRCPYVISNLKAPAHFSGYSGPPRADWFGQAGGAETVTVEVLVVKARR
jgi:hypothetical protein